jgi:AraC-like DNA-binding protein/mannose-6-phosphate isomerase-like protein (cupin superfamily)
MLNATDERTVFNLQDYGVNRGLSFGHYRYNEVKPGLDVHNHKAALEICFCMKGQQQYRVAKNLYQLNGNDIFIVPPDVKHSTGDFPEDKGELFWIQILLEKSNGKLCNLPEKQSRLLLDSLLEKAQYIFKGSFQVKIILEKLIFQLKNGDSIFSKIIINQLIVQLLLETILLSRKPQSQSSSEKLTILDKFILENLYRIIYVDELANLAGMSTGYFKTWFKSKSGMPPKEYVNRFRVEQAKVNLLKQGSITKVAFDLGFSSSQYFATTFKKFTGHTPKSYVKNSS